jgi:flagellin-like protein
MKYRNFRRNRKAISPIISTLLLIAIAVVASLVAYAWVMGYIGFQTNKTGQSIQIQSIAYSGSGSTFTIYVQNNGDSPLILDSAYINGGLAGTFGTTPLQPGSTTSLSITASNPALTSGLQNIDFKATANSGTFSQVTKQFTIP